MKLRLKFVVCSLVALMALAGCSVNPGFNQLDWVRRSMNFGAKAQLESQLWMLKIGDYQQEAIPIVHDELLTFYLKDGTEIDFKGWNVIALRNWNAYGSSITIEHQESGLVHQLLDGVNLDLACTGYQRNSDITIAEFDVRSASCGDDQNSLWSYTNITIMNDQGDAIWMLHHISPEMPPLEMRLNGASELSEELLSEVRAAI